MATKEKSELTVEQMRSAITALTGKTCISKNPKHLRQRLDDLVRAKQDGEHAAETTTVMSVSMHGKAKAATKRMSANLPGGVSELVRDALRQWALNNGHKNEASNFEVE